MGQDRGYVQLDFKDIKRVTIFAGHYGSGKTNIAVNYALNSSAAGNQTVIADLDIVNPYFRTKDASTALSKKDIKLISSPYANTNVDTPALPAEAYSVIHNKDNYAIIDVGGDDRGALALGRFSKDILAENNYEMLFVINKYRYLTADAASTVEVMHEIEDACGIRFTAIVNNSNLGDETTAQNVIDSLSYADEVSELTGLKVKFTAVKEDIAKTLLNKITDIMPVKIYVKQFLS